jgi:galactosylceramidase
LEPDAIYTLTSTTGQVKGSFGDVPESKPFPFPYLEDFENYSYGETPRYFSDQKGTFETCQSPKGGICLTQIVPEQGILWYNNWLLKPHTLFGDLNWQNYTIEADVLLAGGDAEIGGRYAERDKLGYRWILTRDGRWQLNWQYSILSSGQIEKFKPSDWHHLRLEMKGDQITGFVDNNKLATISAKSGLMGMAFIASTYDRNLFDNIRVEPISHK